jgi:anti-anti-sigma factor
MSARVSASGFDIYNAGNELLISIKGRVVLEDLSRLKEAILPKITRGIESVYVDLRHVDYVDSAGLGLLIGFKMQSKSHGASISLMDPNQAVANVLAISRIDGIFETLSGRDAAEVRDRIAKPGNLLGDKSSSGISGDGAPLPSISADGTLEDSAVEQDDNREAVEEQCRSAVEALRQGDYERSIECYKAALEIDPNYLPALNNLAIVYEKQPNWLPLAVETWNRVLEASRSSNDTKHADRAQRHLTDLANS